MRRPARLRRSPVGRGPKLDTRRLPRDGQRVEPCARPIVRVVGKIEHGLDVSRGLVEQSSPVASPELIDAGLTGSLPSCAGHLRKPFLSTEKLFSHKYHIWLDGNVASFSNSGWRFYTGGAVLKHDSPYIQWYYRDMLPWVHYVPIQKDLSDLLDILFYLKDHDDLAEQIGKNGLQFAREHIAREANLAYLQQLLWEYAALHERSCCSRHAKSDEEA